MNTAKKFLDDGRPLEALERLKNLLPTVDEADEWRIHELIGATFHDLCNPEGSAQAYFNAARTDKFLRSQRAHFSNYLFALHYLPQLTAETLANELEIYNSLYRDTKPLELTHHAEKISVAFIAPHFLDSSAARFYESLLTDFEREKFTVTAWSLSSDEDFFTKKIRRNVDGYFDISETSFEESAIKIRDAGCDVLVDLGGHTEGGSTLQIAAYKPCRVQVTGIGYFDSTGLDAIDYFVGDEFLTTGAHFTEKILSLANVFAFRPNDRMIREKKSLRPFPHKNFTFGCLNNFMKLNDEYLAAVKKILDELPDAKIIFRDTTPLASRQRALIERLKTFGIERAEVRRGADNFFTDYSEIDLILDAFPYPGGMMTALALYMKVPVLNLRGSLPSSRTGADILHIAGMDELIVRDEETFIATAIELATNRARLACLTEKISVDKMTDTKTFVADFYAKISEVI